MILSLDTSTATMALALLDDSLNQSGKKDKQDEVLAERSCFAQRNHSILLVEEIRLMMEKANVTTDQLQAIVVGQGPGSYTGVRVGVTVAKTMAWALTIPLIGVSSLEALALGVYRQQSFQQETRWIIPCFDARRGNAYCSLFSTSADGLIRLKEDKKRSMADWMLELNGKRQEAIVDEMMIVGEIDRFEANMFGQNPKLPEAIVAGRDVGQLGMKRLYEGEQVELHAFTPNYTQLADVEAKYLALEQNKGL